MQGRLLRDQTTVHVPINQMPHALRATNGLSPRKERHALRLENVPGRNKELSQDNVPYSRSGLNSHV